MEDHRTPDPSGQDSVWFTSPDERARWQPPLMQHTKRGVWLGFLRRRSQGHVEILAWGNQQHRQDGLSLDLVGKAWNITRVIINVRGIPLSLDACLDPDPAGPRHVTLQPRVPGSIPLHQFEALAAEWRALTAAGTQIRVRRGPRPKVTVDTAPLHAERIAAAYRAFKDAHNGFEPSQNDLVNEYGADIRYFSVRGFELHLKQLRTFNYMWPDDFR